MHPRFPPEWTTAVSDLGFRFLLIGTYGQLWLVLKQYITGAEGSRDGELASVISFLLRLGSQAQTCICVSALTPLEHRVAAHMAQLGLAKPFTSGSGTWLAGTPLAAIMAGGQAGTARAAADGFIVVESNYRCVCACVRVRVCMYQRRCDVACACPAVHLTPTPLLALHAACTRTQCRLCRSPSCASLCGAT